MTDATARRTTRRYLVLGFICVASALAVAAGIEVVPELFEPSLKDFGLSETADIVGFKPVTVIDHRFETIKNAPVIAALQADDILHEDELVIGVAVGDEARAYPINMLTGPEREIINDTVGGRALAATW